MIKRILLFIFLGLSLNLPAQSPIDQVLESVLQNNIDLKAQKQYLESIRAGYKTGLTPTNPEIEYEKNFSDEEGKPVEILIKQGFDFPTSYLHRIRLANEREKNLENQYAQIRQQVLLKTKLNCLQLIYHLKRKEEFSKRYENATKLKDHFEKKLAEGDATILDLNKVKMEVMNIRNKLQLNQIQINDLNEELKKLNGGNPVSFDSKIYPTDAIQKNYSDLINELQVLDPTHKELFQNEKIASREVSLARSESLPKWSIGYKYFNSDISKQANGMQLGLTIPLWENKNRVKQAKQNRLFQQDALNVYQVAFQSEIQQLYQKHQNLKESLDEYKTTFKEADSTDLLGKALELGEISSIEYFLEIRYYYESYDTYLEVENEYYKTIAQLNKYRL